MNEYIEILTKIKDAVILPTATDGAFETFTNMAMAGVLSAIIACVIVVVSDNMNKISNFFDFVKVISSLVAIVSMMVTIVMTMGMVLYLALIPNELSKESNAAISNYVAEMNDPEYSRLEKLVKLYGNNLSSNDKTIKQINKYLKETIGK